MAKFLLVHGIHDKTVNGTLSPLAMYLRKQGHTVREHAYPHRWAVSYYSKGILKRDAKMLFNNHKKDEILISHSNGCLLAQEAFKLGLQCPQWFAFSGACTSDKMNYPVTAFNHAYIIYNPYDTAIWAGARLLWHPYGKLGCIGYIEDKDGTTKSNIHNINGTSKKNFSLDHSHYFKRELDLWGEFILKNVESPVSQLGIIRGN